METAVTTSSPTPTIGVWLDNLLDGAFKDDVLSALQSLEGLPLEVHLSLAHNFLSTAPRSASAIAAYALAGWGPLGVAVRMAELYPEDEGVQAAAQTARMVADSTGSPRLTFTSSALSTRSHLLASKSSDPVATARN